MRPAMSSVLSGVAPGASSKLSPIAPSDCHLATCQFDALVQVPPLLFEHPDLPISSCWKCDQLCDALYVQPVHGVSLVEVSWGLRHIPSRIPMLRQAFEEFGVLSSQLLRIPACLRLSEALLHESSLPAVR